MHDCFIIYSSLGILTDRHDLDVELHGQSIGLPKESEIDDNAVISWATNWPKRVPFISNFKNEKFIFITN